jgi:dihydroorotate dehydrogenase electron transfer subunit
LSVYRIAANAHRITRIISVRTESPSVKTFTFKDKTCAKARPGQFLMLWIPGVDEIPMSILDANQDGRVSVAIKKVGEATKALHQKRAGAIIGVRGPFGNSFTARTGRILIVGGGTGIAPLFLLTKKAGPKTSKIVFAMGAKTKGELLFMDELEKMLCKERSTLIVTSEDGSCGIPGLCTEPLEHLLAEEKFDAIYACGPEQMMLKVFSLAEKYGIPFEASLERLMRCAIGLCGSCIIGKYRVCRDGPVFTASQLRDVRSEFGVSRRDFNGKKIPVE